MPKHIPNTQYPNVNELAAEQGLIWDGHHGGSAEDIRDVQPLIDPSRWNPRVAERYEHLFDHVIRLKHEGAGRRPPVMAVSAPYLRNDRTLTEAVLAFCAAFGLAARVGDERYRIYAEPRTLPIVFWRPDRHLLR